MFHLKIMTNVNKFIAIVGAMFITALALAYVLSVQQAHGSTPSEASDYIATSTAANGSAGAFTSSRALKFNTGSFGSYVITGANTGIVNFYDATTTNVLLRTNNTATSSILLASFPASATVGTYVIDAALKYGLYVEITGSAPTSTISYR